jgi:hypothetical protein
VSAPPSRSFGSEGAVCSADLFWRSAVRPPLTTKSRGPKRQVRVTCSIRQLWHVILALAFFKPMSQNDAGPRNPVLLASAWGCARRVVSATRGVLKVWTWGESNPLP